MFHYIIKSSLAPKALFTNDVYKPYHYPMLQIIMFVDGTVQGVFQRMSVDETLKFCTQFLGIYYQK